MDAILKASLPKLREKLLEALQAVLPIAAIVLVLCFTIAPVSPSILLCFLLGAAMIVVGIMFFTLGAEMSMTPMGERVGAVITKSRKLPVILGIGFLLGFLITISEPDLQVLANQVPSIPNRTLILSVAAGVGLFLVFAFLRMLIGISLPKLLVLFYGMIFLLAAFVPKEFLAVAFDSGGVTTGPMTVPFIMALGVGVSAIRGDRHAADDSFGLVAMCSIGPILAVLILGIVFRASDSTYIPPVLPEVSDSVELWQLFHVSLPTYLEEIAVSLLPIIVMFGIFQFVALHMDRRSLGRIAVGLAYTYVGLVLFLTGANVGFMPAGNYLGQVMAARSYRWVLVPVGGADRIFYCQSGTGGLCAEPSGRGADGRRYFGPFHGREPVRGCLLIRSTGDDPGADGNPDSMVFDPGLRCGDRTILFCYRRYSQRSPSTPAVWRAVP